MAFNCDFSNVTATTAVFTAQFSGGQATYSFWRMVKLTISDPNATSDSKEVIVVSTSAGSGSSDFVSYIQGLKADTEYSYKAELGYGVSQTDFTKITWMGQLDEESGTTKYSASGSFETSSDGTTSYFTCSDMSTEKDSITLYASLTYDETISSLLPSNASTLTVLYSKDPSLSNPSTLTFAATAHESTSNTDGSYEWDATINGLDPSSTYYWKAYSGTSIGVTGYAEGNSTTLPAEPNALSLKILPLSGTTATLTATYYDAETDSLSDYITLHYQFSTNSGSSWGSWKTCTGTVDDDNHFIVFKDDLTNLTASETYDYRAYVGSTNPWA